MGVEPSKPSAEIQAILDKAALPKGGLSFSELLRARQEKEDIAPLAFRSARPHNWPMASRKVSILFVTLALFAASAGSTYAASGEGPWHPSSFGEAVLATGVFGLMGIVLAIVGFKLFDLVTPFNLEKEMCENKNVAVGILCGGIVLGICWIVAASMS